MKYEVTYGDTGYAEVEVLEFTDYHAAADYAHEAALGLIMGELSPSEYDDYEEYIIECQERVYINIEEVDE